MQQISSSCCFSLNAWDVPGSHPQHHHQVASDGLPCAGGSTRFPCGPCVGGGGEGERRAKIESEATASATVATCACARESGHWNQSHTETVPLQGADDAPRHLLHEVPDGTGYGGRRCLAKDSDLSCPLKWKKMSHLRSVLKTIQQRAVLASERWLIEKARGYVHRCGGAATHHDGSAHLLK